MRWKGGKERKKRKDGMSGDKYKSVRYAGRIRYFSRGHNDHRFDAPIIDLHAVFRHGSTVAAIL